MKLTGVLGGSFNPIHNAHLSMAKCAHEQLSIPEILIMPTASTYYKDGSVLIDSKLRMDMIRLAIDEINASSYMKPSALDLDRGGITYTYDTISELKPLYDKIYFIIGSDSLMYIDKWLKADVFLKMCTLLVSKRDGDSDGEIFSKCRELKRIYEADILFLDTEVRPLSSSDIRKRIKEGLSVEGLMPESVIDYIYKNKLYI